MRFHIGTSEIVSRIVFPDRPHIEPGEEAYGQILLEKPTVAAGGDRFVLRSYSPVTTIGGGVILDPLARRWKARDRERRDEWGRLHQGTALEKTTVILKRAGLSGTPGNASLSGQDFHPGN